MNIALFHTTLPEAGRKPGGVEVAVHRLANALSKEDDVCVYALTEAPAGARYRHRQLFADHRKLADSTLLRLFVLPALLNRVSLDGHDVVHLHGDDWFWFSRGIPSVRTMHGSALEEARSATSLKRRMMQYAVYPLEHLSARLATVGAVVGPRTAQIYRLSTLVDNGVDPDRFHPGEKTAHPSLLFVGTWVGRKRGEFVFERFINDVLPRIPEARLTMVSDRCPDHAAVDHVVFPDDDRLAALYRSAWLFAYPSTYEGFGIPYVEAMASGTAVLCSSNDGARYVLDDGRYGWIADDHEFGEAAATLLEDDTRRTSLVASGLERAARFTWDAVAEQHRAVYRAAIAQYRGRP